LGLNIRERTRKRERERVRKKEREQTIEREREGMVRGIRKIRVNNRERGEERRGERKKKEGEKILCLIKNNMVSRH